MERITKGLKPERVWYYFEEISRIPRASGNEGAIREFIAKFASSNDLESIIDDAGNVLLTREPSKGFEKKPVLVIQSHMDMVCEKNEGVEHDFLKDPVELLVDGEWVRAKNTTLGADNGIGVASMLALLEDRSIQTGKLECLFTVEEETGLFGAVGLRDDLLEGRFLINLDTEDVGAVYIGCAGGRDSHITLPLVSEKPEGRIGALKIKVRGAKGGHSGVDIHEGRANAIKLLARILKILTKKEVSVRIAAFFGGDKMNAIPREASCTIVLKEGLFSKAEEIISSYSSLLRAEYQRVDPNIAIEVKKTSIANSVYDSSSTVRVINLLLALPHGVLAMSTVMEDLVETSTNLASVKTEGDKCVIGTSQRSSKESALEWISDMHDAISELSSARIEQDEGYPGWSPDPNSKLLKHTKNAMRRVLGKEARVMAVHAGLECGVIKDKYEGMDAISIGPTVMGGHSPDERVDIQSVDTFWKILLETLHEIYNN
jgi:dipeptidase D